MFKVLEPFKQRKIEIPNRIVLSPMCMYSANEDGTANDFHLTHYTTQAKGRIGLIMLEATAVESRGRISNKDLGLWDDSHIEALQKIASCIKKEGSRAGIQLAHAGRKAEVDEDIISSTSTPFTKDFKGPLRMEKAHIKRTVDAFRDAAERASKANFDILEIHAAHGYLIHQFLSPITNKRKDKYGGSLKNRARFLLEIVHNVRKVWGEDKPLYVRISAVDHKKGGLKLGDSVAISKLLKDWDVDLVDVSSGAITEDAKPSNLTPGYQVEYSESIKAITGAETGAVGLITTFHDAEHILENNQADLIFIGRELLRNPYWLLQNMQTLGLEYIGPKQYKKAF